MASGTAGQDRILIHILLQYQTRTDYFGAWLLKEYFGLPNHCNIFLGTQI